MLRLQHPIMGLGLGLIVVQAAVRGVALYRGWFYGDDFEFLQEATDRGLGLGYLMQPHDSQLMPAGIFTVWGVAQSQPYNWALAGSLILVFQVLASSACWLMLCEVFGLRWQCVGLLCLYLFSTLTLTAFMWWSAAINQVPTQLAFFVAVLFHVRYLRSRRLTNAVIAALSLVFGLLFYVKAVLIVIPLLLLTFWYFTDQSVPLKERMRRTVIDHWRVWTMYAVVVAVYLQYYVRNVPNPIAADNAIPYGRLLDTMIRVSLGPAMLGGPWQWSIDNPPLGLVHTPDWAVTISWMLLAAALALLWRARRVDWRAFGVLLPYLVVSFFLVARGRASLIGGSAGLELRYLADAAPVLILSLGVLLLGRGGIEGDPPPPPYVGAPRLTLRHIGLVGAIAVLALGAVLSNVSYMQFWADPYPAKAFVRTVIQESHQQRLNVVNVPVPPLVLPGTSFPGNLPSNLFKPLGKDRVTATDVGNDLDILDSAGHAARAAVTGARSRQGPLLDCGYAVHGAPLDIDFVGTSPRFFWWMEMSYAANQDGAMELSVGGLQHRFEVEGGLHRLFFQGQDSTADFSLQGLTPGLVACVDQIDIGDIGPEAAPRASS